MSTNWADGPDVASAACVSRAARVVRSASASATAMRQPSRPGGASPTTMSPPASTSARVTPSAAMAPSPCWMMYPLAMPPRSSRMPGRPRRTDSREGSRCRCRHPTCCLARSMAVRSGSCRRWRASRQSATRGPTVGSKAPSVADAIATARSSTAKSSGLHDRPRFPGTAEAPELAVRAIVAHHPVELSNARESGRRGRSCLVFRRGVQAEPDRHAHVDLGELVR